MVMGHVLGTEAAAFASSQQDEPLIWTGMLMGDTYQSLQRECLA